MRLLSFLIVTLTAFTASAQEDARGWSTVCAVGSAKHEVTFISSSGFVTEDDMKVRVGGDDQHFPAWFYMPVAKTDDSQSACDNTAAFPVDASHTLLLIVASGRPGYDYLFATVLDARGKLTQPQFLASYDGSPVGITKNAARARAVQGTNTVTKSDGPDGYCFATLLVKGARGKPAPQWSSKRPAHCKPEQAPKLAHD